MLCPFLQNNILRVSFNFRKPLSITFVRMLYCLLKKFSFSDKETEDMNLKGESP